MIIKIKLKTLIITLIAITTTVLLFIFVKTPKVTQVKDIYGRESIDSNIRHSLEEEFNDAYIKDIKSTGNIVEVNLTAKEEKIEIFEDNVTTAFSYNGQIPGPTIKVKLGDTIKVNLKNELNQPTTIHWHGVRVPFEMDGVPNVSQTPVEPGETFTYEFTPKDVGTFWYHPHIRGSEQLEKGLYGVLIVEDPDPNEIKFDEDIIWNIDDWNLTRAGDINPNFVTPTELMHDGRWGDYVTNNGSLNYVSTVKPGSTIRLRMVNTSNGRHYMPTFSRKDIKDFNVKVIAIDGMYVKEPFEYNEYFLAPGNRIDLQLTIPKEIEQNTQIKVLDKFTEEGFQLGTIKVLGKTLENLNIGYNKTTYIPSWEQAIDKAPDYVYELDASGHMMNISWLINNQKYPDIDKNSFNAGEFVKIQFKNESARLHPMHLHGQFFKVLGRWGRAGIPNEAEDYFRDTVIVWPNETVEVGIVPLDEGTWPLHCHIQEHAEAGMMTLFDVK